MTCPTEPETASRSALETVNHASDVALAKIIEDNAKRCLHLGVEPRDIALNPDTPYQEGDWTCVVSPLPEGRVGVSYKFRGTGLKDEPYLVFVGEKLLHVFLPTDNYLLRFRTRNPVAEGVNITIVSRSGVLRHAEAGDFLPSLPPIDLLQESEAVTTDLRGRIEAGYYVQKKGTLIKPFLESEKKKHSLLKLYQHIDSIISEKMSYRVYATHGTLLGLVRSGDLIANDDDFDCAYLSSFETCEDVAQERRVIYDALQAAGLECKWGLTGHIKVGRDKMTIDLMPAWFDEVDYNVAGFTTIPRAGVAILPLRTVRLLDHEINIPAESEHFLEKNYGHSWRVPDPFYKSKLSTKAKRHRKCLQRIPEAIG